MYDRFWSSEKLRWRSRSINQENKCQTQESLSFRIGRQLDQVEFNTSFWSRGWEDFLWVLYSNYGQHPYCTNSQCGRQCIWAEASSHQHGASQLVLWKGTWRYECSSPTLPGDLQHFHHQRSDQRRHITPPFPILPLGECEAMVLC